MKKLYAPLLVLLLAAGQLLAQPGANPCRQGPLSNQEFSTLLSSLDRSQAEATRLTTALQSTRDHCLTSEQMMAIMQLLGNDANRYAFGEARFGQVVDPERFFMVFDSFVRFSYALELYHITLAGSGTRPDNTWDQNNNNNNNNAWNGEPMPQFPRWQYPNAANYTGANNCTRFMGDDESYTLLERIWQAGGEYARFRAAQQAVTTNCWTVAHLLELTSLLQDQAHRYRIIELAFDRTYDPGNYPYLGQALTSPNLQQTFNQYLANLGFQPLGSGPVQPACGATDAEFQQIHKYVNGGTFDSGRLPRAKEMIVQYGCLTSIQISKLVQLMSFDDARLELAQVAYARCSDPENYFIIMDHFSFSSTQQKLRNFIKENRR